MTQLISIIIVSGVHVGLHIDCLGGLGGVGCEAGVRFGGSTCGY